jgi:hypothetical protein
MVSDDSVHNPGLFSSGLVVKQDLVVVGARGDPLYSPRGRQEAQRET